MRTATILVVVFGSIMAAGCSDPDPSTAALDDSVGTLAVRVVDTELIPLDQARVWVDGTMANATSDAAGLVVIASLSPGSHAVRANRTGYWDNTTKITVVANETTELWVEMQKVPGPFDVRDQQVARPYCAFVLPPLPDEPEPRCRSPPLATGPQATFSFASNVLDMVLRMRWDATSEASGRMVFNLSLREASFANGSQSFTVEGVSPLRVELNRPVLATDGAKTGGNLSVLVRTPEWDPEHPYVDQSVEVNAYFLYRHWPDLSQGPPGP